MDNSWRSLKIHLQKIELYIKGNKTNKIKKFQMPLNKTTFFKILCIIPMVKIVVRIFISLNFVEKGSYLLIDVVL